MIKYVYVIFYCFQHLLFSFSHCFQVLFKHHPSSGKRKYKKKRKKNTRERENDENFPRQNTKKINERKWLSKKYNIKMKMNEIQRHKTKNNAHTHKQNNK